MKNEWKQLREENRLRQERLREQDQDVLQDVLKYLKSTNRNPYDLEVLRKDLIGMAEEAQSRGENLQAVIGADRKEFCEGLAETMRPGNIMDCIVFTIPPAIWGVSFALFLSMSKDRSGVAVGSTDGVCFLLVAFYFFLMTIIYQRTRFRYQSGQPNYKALGLGVGLFLVVAGIAYMYGKVSQEIWFTLPWPVAVAGVFALWGAVVFYQNRRVAQLAQQNPWKDVIAKSDNR